MSKAQDTSKTSCPLYPIPRNCHHSAERRAPTWRSAAIPLSLPWPTARTWDLSDLGRRASQGIGHQGHRDGVQWSRKCWKMFKQKDLLQKIESEIKGFLGGLVAYLPISKHILTWGMSNMGTTWVCLQMSNIVQLVQCDPLGYIVGPHINQT